MNDNNPQIYTIELVGSHAARHVETGTTNDQTGRRNCKTTRSPIPALCRDLIAIGHNPDAPTNVVRRKSDGPFMPIFTGNRTLGRWAELDCIESPTKSASVKRYQPFVLGSDDVDLDRAA